MISTVCCEQGLLPLVVTCRGIECGLQRDVDGCFSFRYFHVRNFERKDCRELMKEVSIMTGLSTWALCSYVGTVRRPVESTVCEVIN